MHSGSQLLLETAWRQSHWALHTSPLLVAASEASVKDSWLGWGCFSMMLLASHRTLQAVQDSQNTGYSRSYLAPRCKRPSNIQGNMLFIHRGSDAISGRDSKNGEEAGMLMHFG